MAPIPTTRQKRSNEMSTSCRAASKSGLRAIDEGVVMFVMALLLCGFDTPSLAAQGGQRLPSYFNIQRGNPNQLGPHIFGTVTILHAFE
jgi:hypothetical protein